MEQHDLIKDEIEQLGRVLGNILAKFLGLKGKGQLLLSTQLTNEALKSELDIDIELLIDLDEHGLIAYFEKRKLADSHIGQLADYLYEVAMLHEVDNNAETIKLLEKVLLIFEIQGKNSETFSMQRAAKEQSIRTELLRRKSKPTDGRD